MPFQINPPMVQQSMSALESPSQNSLQNPSAPHQRSKNSPHASHVIMAVQSCFLGASYHWPWLKTGFTDFDNPEPFTEKDLKAIQKEMVKIINQTAGDSGRSKPRRGGAPDQGN